MHPESVKAQKQIKDERAQGYRECAASIDDNGVESALKAVQGPEVEMLKLHSVSYWDGWLNRLIEVI